MALVLVTFSWIFLVYHSLELGPNLTGMGESAARPRSARHLLATRPERKPSGRATRFGAELLLAPRVWSHFDVHRVESYVFAASLYSLLWLTYPLVHSHLRSRPRRVTSLGRALDRRSRGTRSPFPTRASSATSGLRIPLSLQFHHLPS